MLESGVQISLGAPFTSTRTMIPIFQANSDAITGDCLSACIASILEIDPKTVPNLNLWYRHNGTMFQECNAWLRGQGKRVMWWGGRVHLPDYHIMCYLVGRHPHTAEWIGHAVVGQNGQPVHCPINGTDFDHWWMTQNRVYASGLIF